MGREGKGVSHPVVSQEESNERYGIVIPGLTRNPEVHHWIPAFAGMTENQTIPHTD